MRIDRWLMLRKEEGQGAEGGSGAGSAGAGAAGADAAGGGAAPQDWRTGISDEGLRKDDTLARYKTLDDAARGIVNQHKALSTVVTKIPGKDAKPEEHAAFREKVLGIPPDVAKYREAVKVPTIEGVSWDQKAIEGFTAKAHQWGIPPDVVPQLLGELATYEKGSTDRMVSQWVKEQETLEGEWGADYDSKVSQAKTAFAFYNDGSGGRLESIFKASGLDRNPDVLRMFSHLGEMLHEHGYVEGEVRGGDTSKEQAGADIAAIRANAKHPAMDPSHPKHAEEFEKLMKLYQVRDGRAPVTT